MTAVRVERRAAADRERLFSLYGGVFGEKLTEASRRRWSWQYLDNPHGDTAGPDIWVAKEGAHTLGQYASMPVRLWWGGREVRSSWGMDVFLRKEARGRGVGALLFTAWSDHVEVALGLGLTPSSYGLFKKLRYTDVGPVPFLQKVLDPRAVARRRLGRVLGTLVAPIVTPALWLRFRQRVATEVPGIGVRRIDRFGAEYDALWKRTRASYAMCVRRDAVYLNWKYVQCPHRSYALWEARRGEQLVGFAVSRHVDHQGLRLGWILDVFTDAEDQPAQNALIAEVLEDFRRAGVARAQAFSMNNSLATAFRSRGFVPGRSPMQFCVRSRVPDQGVLKTPGRWHVVFGDSDMDR